MDAERIKRLWAGKTKRELIAEIARMHEAKPDQSDADPDVHKTKKFDTGLSVLDNHVSIEKTIEEGEGRFRLLVENVPDSLVLHDTNGNIVLVNGILSQALGYSREQLLTMNVRDIEVGLPPMDLKSIWHTMTEAKTLKGRHRRQDGSEFPVEVCVSRFGTPENPLFLALARDMSERENIEQKLVLARDIAEQANRSKSEFLANMSHELRTPLNSIIGFSEVIKNETFGSVNEPRYQEYIRDIHRSGSHLLQVINDILDMAKIESHHVDVNDEIIIISDLIEECERMVTQPAQQAAVTVHSQIGPGLNKLLVDRRRLSQILINLLTNSIKFTPKGGKITISCARDVSGSINLSVADTGIGIPQSDVAHIFEPFVQSREHSTKTHEGTGLGLSLVRALTQLQGGTVILESEVGKGTVVTVTLPSERVID